MKKIATVDLLIADVMVPYEMNGKLENYIENTLHVAPGGKKIINKEEAKKLSGLLAARPHTVYRGGASSITMDTLGRLMNGKVECHIIGGVGNDLPNSQVITEGFGPHTKLHLINREAAETAVSFILTYPDGKSTNITYPGNAKDLVNSGTIPWKVIEDADTLFLQDSMRERFDPKLMNDLLSHRWETGKKLVLAYPTSGFDEQSVENEKFHNKTAASADIILTNTDQVRKAFPDTRDTKASLSKLQEHMLVADRVLNEKGHPPQTALVTDGANGAYVVTSAHQPIHVPAEDHGIDIPGGLAAGDTAYGSFIGGLGGGLPPREAARAAMILAGEKKRVEAPSLDDPRATLHKTEQGRLLLRQMDRVHQSSRDMGMGENFYG